MTDLLYNKNSTLKSSKKLCELVFGLFHRKIEKLNAKRVNYKSKQD